MMKRSLEEIQLEVAQWSKSQFGQQQSQVDPDLFLRSLAPLLGLAEECGEYFASQNEEETKDALADIGIFLCDYAGREGFILQEPERVLWLADGWDEDVTRLDAVVGIVVSVGRLCHVTLKRHQGIRGMDQPEMYREVRNLMVNRLMFYCIQAAREEFEVQWLDLVTTTWDKIVSKRDWSK